jgi:hypothetical protein
MNMNILFDVVGFCWVEFDNVRVRQSLSTGRFSSGDIIGEWLLFEDRRATNIQITFIFYSIKRI